MPLQPTESRRRSQAHGGFFVNPQIHESTVLATFPQEKVPMIRGESREKILALPSEDGILERIGPDKGGRWHIVK